MDQQGNNTETVQVKYNRYSAWTVVKVLIFTFIITFVGNTFSYLVVSYNHMWSKVVGLSNDAIEFCNNCLQALG